MPITLTDKAVSEVNRIIAEQEEENKIYLRMRVVGGGCSGFQPKLDLDNEIKDIDEVYNINGVDIVIDKRSILYLVGSSVDFQDGTVSGFVITNPNQQSTCACSGHH